VATIAALAGAAVSAYGAYSQNQNARRAANAAGRGQEGYEDSTTSNFNQPYAPAAQQIDDAFRLIQEEYQRGAHQQAAGGRGGAGGGGGGGGQDLSGVVVQGGVPGVMSRRGQFQPLGGNARAAWERQQGGGTTPAGPGGAAPGGPPSDPAAMAQWFAQQTANDVANPSQGVRDAQDYGHDILTGGTDEEPFARNPILNDLYGRLGGADFDRSQNLLEGFLGGRYGGAGGGNQNATGNGQVPTSQIWTGNPSGGTGGWGGSGSSGGSSSSGGGVIPDSMDDESSWFNEQVRALFDPSALDPANDPTLQPLLETLRRDSRESLGDQMDQIGDEATGLNMYGGSGFQVERGRARGDAEAGLADAEARTLYQSRNDAMLRRMQSMGLVSERDLAAMQDRTQRYGIDASASAAGAGAAASAALGNRSLDLQAILGLQGMDQFGLGALGDLGGALTGDQRFAAGTLTPTLEALRGDQIAGGFGMSNTLAQQRAAQQAAAANRQSAQQRARALAPGQDLEDYLARLTGLANPYAVNTTNSHRDYSGGGGPGYSGPSAGASAAAAGIGSLAQAYGSGAFTWGHANTAAGGGGAVNPYQSQPPPGRSGPYY